MNKALNADSWWQAFVETKAIIERVAFGVQSAGSSDAVLVSVSPGAKKTDVSTGEIDAFLFLKFRVKLLGGQSRADQIEVSLNEDIKSEEGRKMKQGH